MALRKLNQCAVKPAHCAQHYLARLVKTLHYTLRSLDSNTDADWIIGTQHVHFRGRHLHGTSLPLPPNYTGAVLNMTDKLAAPCASWGPHTTHKNLPTTADSEDDDEHVGEEIPEEIKVAEQVGDFEAIVVWGHGGQVDEGSDMFVRGIKEWVGFAESMHCNDEDSVTERQGKGDQTL